ncbi:L-threonylcarbamoyladenylate synthase [Pontibacillus sp. ALD_SL1]|uniref:L-threonylcarbamoyladenylate synthase n=1 Tax=Pontibacillus sp. ALD_SL1 TaxID=2777185 RepID=UPI001F62558A|nr:L-threonylcarbamoyladenylate synthase [Pontibacillus sp. ALD_SL1]
MSTTETKFWTIDPSNVDSLQIEEAAALLRDNQAVAFPTETVYGLGANALNEQAVQGIFAAKGRPADNPLIVHVANKEQIEEVVTHIPKMAHKLIDAFTPGPLTLILESNGSCASNVTAGLSSVGVRIPDHPVARALLQTCRLPLAAPSANRSGRPSPTSAEHVYKDLNGRVAGIVDGGPTGVGVESTVVDCTGDRPVILRPGGITKEDLEEVVGPTDFDPALINQEEKPKSPGMKYTHYAPEAPLWLVEGDLAFLQRQIDQLQQNDKRVGVIVSQEHAGHIQADEIQICGSRDHLNEVAVHLYGALRSFSTDTIDVILCESFPEYGMGYAVMNRLKKAATQVITQDE